MKKIVKKFLSVTVIPMFLFSGVNSFAGSLDSQDTKAEENTNLAPQVTTGDLRLTSYTDSNGKVNWVPKKGLGNKVGINIDTTSGNIDGFTGCRGFSAKISRLEKTYKVYGVERTFPKCPKDPAIKKIDKRYLQVLKGEVTIKNVYKDVVITNVHTKAKLQFR